MNMIHAQHKKSHHLLYIDYLFSVKFCYINKKNMQNLYLSGNENNSFEKEIDWIQYIFCINITLNIIN